MEEKQGGRKSQSLVQGRDKRVLQAMNPEKNLPEKY
jgi:hypothetical protein